VADSDVDVLNVPLVKHLLLAHGMYHNVLRVQRGNIILVALVQHAPLVNIRHTLVKQNAIPVVVVSILPTVLVLVLHVLLGNILVRNRVVVPVVVQDITTMQKEVVPVKVVNLVHIHRLLQLVANYVQPAITKVKRAKVVV
jgi:hypothetical protein